eukprot:19960-Alexandrium_andersonii.AAC.1
MWDALGLPRFGQYPCAGAGCVAQARARVLACAWLCAACVRVCGGCCGCGCAGCVLIAVAVVLVVAGVVA